MAQDPRRDERQRVTARSVEPHEVWSLLERGDVRLLDLRTELERRRHGAPPGAVPVSLARHILSPAGQGTIYLSSTRESIMARSSPVMRASFEDRTPSASTSVAKVWRRLYGPQRAIPAASRLDTSRASAGCRARYGPP